MNGIYRNLRSALNRKTIHSCRNRWECNCSDSVLHRNLHRIIITACKKLIFIIISTIPDRSDCVDHIITWQIICLGNLCLSCFASMKHPAFSKKFRTCGMMDCTINTPSSKKRIISSIYNCLYICNFGYITFDCFNRIHKLRDTSLLQFIIRNFSSPCGILPSE